MPETVESIFGTYLDTFRKIGLWFGWLLYHMDRLNERVFDLITSHEPCKIWRITLAIFIRRRGTAEDGILQKAAGQALAVMELMGERDNDLLYKCLYGLRLYRCILGSHLRRIVGHRSGAESAATSSPILSDDEINLLLKAYDEMHRELD